jgi:hypothetical protein
VKDGDTAIKQKKCSCFVFVSSTPGFYASKPLLSLVKMKPIAMNMQTTIKSSLYLLIFTLLHIAAFSQTSEVITRYNEGLRLKKR